MHTGPMPETAGTFDGWKQETEYGCRKCDSRNVQSKCWESSCGGYEDYKFKCGSCGHTWWVEGPDA